MESSEFCRLFGNSIRNHVFELFLDFTSIDIAGVDIANFLDISKPSVYAAIKDLEEENLIRKTRVIGRTQMYKLNKDDRSVKLLLKLMRGILDHVIDDHTQKYDMQQRKALVAERRRRYKK